MRFKLLRGLHFSREPANNGKDCDECLKEDPNTGEMKGTGKVRNRHKGNEGMFDCPACKGTGKEHTQVQYDSKDPERNIIDTDINLEERYGREKFENLDRVASADNNAAIMEQLRKLQEENAKLQAENAKMAEELEDVEEYEEA